LKKKYYVALVEIFRGCWIKKASWGCGEKFSISVDWSKSALFCGFTYHVPSPSTGGIPLAAC
jgi:hypothetical protein